MSRIGKKAVPTPAGVTASIDGQTLTVKGPKGQLSWTLPEEIELRQEGAELVVAKRVESTRAQAMWGLSRTLVNNMVVGVTEGFTKELEIVGVGYRAEAQGQNLRLALGFSHPVIVPAPDGISFEIPAQTRVIVKGIDKELVGQVAANIRSIRKPEPYKGKGVRYLNERILRKAGKTGKK